MVSGYATNIMGTSSPTAPQTGTLSTNTFIDMMEFANLDPSAKQVYKVFFLPLFQYVFSNKFMPPIGSPLPSSPSLNLPMNMKLQD